MKPRNLVIAVLVVSGLISGCANTPTRDAVEPVSSAQLVSHDLVAVLNQVRELNPATTVLFMPLQSMPDDAFTHALYDRLQIAGYAIRTSGQADRSRLVSYAITPDNASDQTSSQTPGVTYTVSVGKVSVRRTYQTPENGLTNPVSAMQIKGADPSQLSIDDAIFARARERQRKELNTPDVETIPTTSGEISEPAAPAHLKPDDQPTVPVPEVLATSPAIDADQGDMALNSRSSVHTHLPSASHSPVLALQAEAKSVKATGSRTLQERLKAIGPQRALIANATDASENTPMSPGDLKDIATQVAARVRSNIHHSGQSNFADLFENLGMVKETILTFDNDSTVLGRDNKALMREFIAAFEPDSDFISIVGCSHGHTSVNGGPRELALGRAQRVKQELQYAGIPDERILDEGCWAEERFDERMPRRGVIMTLKRPA